MIDIEIVKKYPSLVARPYLLIKDDFQRKDMQRFWFENTISFLAVLSAAELVRFYKGLKSKENQTPKDLEIIKSLQEHKSLTNVGLEHMSLGKWVMMLRETTRTLQEYNAVEITPELVDFYHGKNGKENAKNIDKLVSIRNADAHGNPIPEDKLTKELNDRQKIIDTLMESLSFLKNYKLVLPEKLEIEGSNQFYICKQFVGNGIINTKQIFGFSPQITEVMLLNSENENIFLALNPLLLYLGIQDEENNFLGIFTKFSSKDAMKANYLNLDGNSDIDLESFAQNQEVNLIEARQSYNEIYADPESFHVNINIDLKFQETSIDIKKESSFSLKITNKKSVDLESIMILIDIPKSIEIKGVEEEHDTYKYEISNNQMVFTIDSLDNNDEITIPEITYEITEQGSFSLDDGRALYSYYKTLSDQESKILTEEETLFSGALIEGLDPNSRDKMIPVINIAKEFIDSDGNPIQNVRVGEEFIFKIVVTNIGFSSAKDVYIDLVFPDKLNLKQGKETIKLSQLNPFEEKEFQYILNSHIPDVYTISMQNILYADNHNIRYNTRCADEYFIIVRSDLIKEFTYTVKEHIDDLYIDTEEKQNIIKMISELSESIGFDAQQTYEDAETEAVIKTVRDLVDKIAIGKDLKVVEKIYEEGKRDSKITNCDPRKLLVFSSKEMPFFAINLSKGYEPEFFALTTTITKRFDRVVNKQAVTKEGSYTLDHSLDFSDIKYDERYGKGFFTQWLNMVLSKFNKEYIVWKELNDNVIQYYGPSLSYLSGQFISYNKETRESGVQNNYVFIDRDNPQSYYIAFGVKPNPIYKQLMEEYLAKNNYFKYLISTTITKDRSRIYDTKNLSFYTYVSDTGRATGMPAINMKIDSDKSMDLMMDRTNELWELLCLSQSLNLFEHELFSGQEYIQELKEFTQKVFDKGFALRQNEKNEKVIEIYPYKNFKPYTSEEKDCIGFIETSNKSWKISLKFFQEPMEENRLILKEKLSLEKYAGNRWIRDSFIRDVEEMELILNTLLHSADAYKANTFAIWPDFMKRQMLINRGQVDTGLFILLASIMNGKSYYSEILEEFKKLGIEKDLRRTLNWLSDFENNWNYAGIIGQTVNEDEIEIYIQNEFLDLIQELHQEKSDLNFLEEGPALFRMYVKQVVRNHTFLSKRAADSNGFVYGYLTNSESSLWGKVEIGVAAKKDNTIDYYFMFIDWKDESDEKVNRIFTELFQKHKENIIIDRAGKQKQHLKIRCIYKYNNFETDLIQLQDFCTDFFEDVDKGIENLIQLS